MRWFLTLVFVVLLPSLPAQQVEMFCDPQTEDSCLPDTLEIVFNETASSVFEAGGLPAGTEIACGLVTETRSEPIQGWSYAVKHDADSLTLTSVTTAGTIVDPDHPDSVFYNPGFNVTQEVPDGWISAVVLALIIESQLPLDQRNVIATASYELVATPGPTATLIEIVSDELGIQGSPPVGINLTKGGAAFRPERLIHGLVKGGEASLPFLRGDSNANGRLTIVDAVFALRYLFDGLEPPPCLASADTDDSGVVEVTDVVYLLRYLFLGEAPPEEPFEACGRDTTPSNLTCDSYAPCESTAPDLAGAAFADDDA